MQLLKRNSLVSLCCLHWLRKHFGEWLLTLLLLWFSCWSTWLWTFGSLNRHWGLKIFVLSVIDMMLSYYQTVCKIIFKLSAKKCSSVCGDLWPQRSKVRFVHKCKGRRRQITPGWCCVFYFTAVIWTNLIR